MKKLENLYDRYVKSKESKTELEDYLIEKMIEYGPTKFGAIVDETTQTIGKFKTRKQPISDNKIISFCEILISKNEKEEE